MKKYSNIISLGHFCSVALELERVGLRDSSMPFDWLITDNFEKVIELIDTHFMSFLVEDSLHQDETNKAYYHDYDNGISFYHDFTGLIDIGEQIESVRNKYMRRIEKFYQKISYPTLFIRYVASQQEADYISMYSERIISVLRSQNKQCDIIYISNQGIKFVNLNNVYSVDVDDDDNVARRFLEKNKNLRKMLNSNIYDLGLRKKNLTFFWRKKIKKYLKRQIKI